MNKKIVRTPESERSPFWTSDPLQQVEILKKEYPKLPDIVLKKAVYGIDQEILKLERKRDKAKTQQKKDMYQKLIDKAEEMVEKMAVGYVPAKDYNPVPRVFGNIPSDVDQSDLNEFPVSGLLISD
jgi:hypothetical protein